MIDRGPQGEKGDRGPQGPQGEQGEQGESVLVGIAEEQVRRLIAARSVPKWMVYSQGIVIAVLAAVVLLLAVWVIPSVRADAVQGKANALEAAQRECTDLKKLAAVTVVKPGPADSPAVGEAYQYHLVLVALERSEKCGV